MRSIVRDGRRIGIHLEQSCWTAIDLIAKHRGVNWQDWAIGALNAVPDPKNKTATLRSAALLELPDVMVADAREIPPFPEDATHPILDRLVATDRAMALAALDGAESIYEADLGGFVLHAVRREDGKHLLIIENKMIDQLSLVISDYQ